MNICRRVTAFSAVLCLIFALFVFSVGAFAQEPAEKTLFAAVAQNDADAVRQALAQGARADALTENDATALMKAAYFGRTEIAALLIDAGASVHRRNAQGQTPLIIATLSAPYDGDLPAEFQYRAVRSAVQGEATIEAKQAAQQRIIEVRRTWEQDAQGRKEAQKTDIVRLLLTKGANPRIVAADGMTALHKAAALNLGPMTRLLLQAGASPFARDAERKTPLLLAVYRGSLNSVQELLVPSGPDGKAAAVNIPGPGYFGSDETPLMCAAFGYGPRLEMVRALIQLGANVNARTADGETALTIAAGDVFDPEFATAHLLLDCGADPKARSKRRGNILCILLQESPGFLLYADNLPFFETESLKRLSPKWRQLREEQKQRIQAMREARQKLVVRLVEAGCEVNGKSAEGVTPLMGAARSGDPVVVQYLLEKGASAVARATSGAGVLHYAAQAAQAETLMLLLKAGADPNLSEGGRTPLLNVAASNNSSVAALRLLLDAGAKINARDANNRTALHAIAESQAASPESVALLLERGADPYAEWNDGEQTITPLMQAIRYHRLPMVKAFLAAGVDARRRNAQGVSALDFARQHLAEARQAQAESPEMTQSVRLLEDATK